MDEDEMDRLLIHEVANCSCIAENGEHYMTSDGYCVGCGCDEQEISKVDMLIAELAKQPIEPRGVEKTIYDSHDCVTPSSVGIGVIDNED